MLFYKACLSLGTQRRKERNSNVAGMTRRYPVERLNYEYMVLTSWECEAVAQVYIYMYVYLCISQMSLPMHLSEMSVFLCFRNESLFISVGSVYPSLCVSISAPLSLSLCLFVFRIFFLSHTYSISISLSDSRFFYSYSLFISLLIFFSQSLSCLFRPMLSVVDIPFMFFQGKWQTDWCLRERTYIHTHIEYTYTWANECVCVCSLMLNVKTLFINNLFHFVDCAWPLPSELCGALGHSRWVMHSCL